MKNFSLKTKANSRRSSRDRQIGRILLITLFSLALLYVLGNSVGQISSTVTLPIYTLKSWIRESSATLPLYIRGRGELIDEINRLKQELSAESGKNAAYGKLISENDELRSFVDASLEEGILAGIIARPPFLPYDAVLIDQGNRDGIREGAVAYHAGGQAVGFVSKAFEESALLTLFSTPGVSATAFVLGPDIFTNLFGEGGGVMRISVPQGITLSEGDIVILPSVESGMLGTIKSIETSPTQPVQNGYVISDIPIQSLHYVLVSRQVPRTVSYEEAKAIVESYKASQFTVEVPDEVIVDSDHATGTSATTSGAVSEE